MPLHMLLLCPNSFYWAFFIRKKKSAEHKCKAVIIVHFLKWKLCESYLIQVGLLFRSVKFKLHTDAKTSPCILMRYIINYEANLKTRIFHRQILPDLGIPSV